MEGTITILNRLNRTDSITGLDVWYKTVIHNAQYKTKNVASASGTTVSMGQSFFVLIPFDDRFKPYGEWKQNPTNGYTLNPTDLIFFGEYVGNVTPQNIAQIKTQNKARMCEIRTIQEVPKRVDANFRFAIEGV